MALKPICDDIGNISDKMMIERLTENRDYLIDKVSRYDAIGLVIYKYFDRWIGHDCYYDGYDYTLIRNEANEIIAIVLAYYTED